jgi:hypothetical protein
MKTKTKQLLKEAWMYCDEEDKSTEFMLEYMQDYANVDLDCVINFIAKYITWKNVLRNKKLQG